MKLFDLQLFADDGEQAETNDNVNVSTEESTEKKEAAKEAKYTDDDVNRMINEKFAKWQKEKEKSDKEAKKLAEMNAQERAEHERDKVQSELDALKEKVAISEMKSEARKMSAEKNVDIPESILDVLVSSDAEKTKRAVDGYINGFQTALSSAIKEALKGNGLKQGKSNTGVTKEEIMKIANPFERQKMINEHKDLFGGK